MVTLPAAALGLLAVGTALFATPRLHREPIVLMAATLLVSESGALNTRRSILNGPRCPVPKPERGGLWICSSALVQRSPLDPFGRGHLAPQF